MRYEVDAAHKESGKQSILVLEAGSPDAAEREANQMGFFVSKVREVPTHTDAPVVFDSAPPATRRKGSSSTGGRTPGHAPGAPSINVHTPRRGSSMGIAAIVLGIVALVFCWVPFIGLFSLPLSGIGLLLAIVGVFVAARRGGSGIGFTIAGGTICGLALLIGGAVGFISLGAAERALRAAETAAAANSERSESFSADRVSEPSLDQPTGIGITNAPIPELPEHTGVSGPLTTPSIPQDQSAPEPPADPKPTWIEAHDDAMLGDMRVRITGVRVGRVRLRDYSGETTSANAAIAISLRIENTSATRKANYRSWRDGGYLSENYATLTDNHGNTYRRINYGSYDLVGAVDGSDSVYPEAAVHDILPFEPPVKAADAIFLTLPGSALGVDEKIVFRIPSEMFAGQ